MSFRKYVDKRLAKKERRYETEQLMKEKRSEQYDALEEVLDRSTLMVLYDFMNKGTIEEIHGAISAGKEARVYWGKDQKGNELAIKIYLTLSAEFRKGMLKYIEGDPRFKEVKRDTRSLIFTWAQKEFRNLDQATRAGVRVPKPFAIKKNVLIMEFIGEDGVSAPSLKEMVPNNPSQIYKALLIAVRKLYLKADLVHGDLSEYNIMIWRGDPIIFDVSQAVSVSHPLAKELLRRDLANLSRFFGQLGVKVLSAEESYKKVTGNV